MLLGGAEEADVAGVRRWDSLALIIHGRTLYDL